MNDNMNEKNSGSRANTASKLIARVIRYMLHYYKIPFVCVIVCILITAIATVVGATFPQTLVDDYITPMLASGSKDFSGLASDLFRQIPFLMNIPKKIIALHFPMRPRWPRSEEPSVFRCGNLCGFVSARIDCIFRGSGTHQVFAAKTSENESLRYRKRFFQNIRACNA